MSDVCDDSDPHITNAVAFGVEASRRALARALPPIVQVINGERVGFCHHCGSEITPGHLFCPTDPIEPEKSCAVDWQHAMDRRRALGL